MEAELTVPPGFTVMGLEDACVFLMCSDSNTCQSPGKPKCKQEGRVEDRKEMNEWVLPYQLNSESALLERKAAISSQRGSLCTFHSCVCQ